MRDEFNQIIMAEDPFKQQELLLPFLKESANNEQLAVALVEFAEHYGSIGYHDLAMTILTSIYQNYPTTEYLFVIAKQLAHVNLYSEAIDWVQKESIEKFLPSQRFNIAIWHKEIEDDSFFVSELKHLVKSSPYFAEPYLALSEYYLNKKETQLAYRYAEAIYDYFSEKDFRQQAKRLMVQALLESEIIDLPLIFKLLNSEEFSTKSPEDLLIELKVYLIAHSDDLVDEKINTIITQFADDSDLIITAMAYVIHYHDDHGAGKLFSHWSEQFNDLLPIDYYPFLLELDINNPSLIIQSTEALFLSGDMGVREEFIIQMLQWGRNHKSFDVAQMILSHPRENLSVEERALINLLTQEYAESD